MEVLVFYGEFIYILSKYEKDRAVPNERWDSYHQITLCESVDIMKYATELILRGGSVDYSESERIVDFINKNVGKIFAYPFYNIPSSLAVPSISGEAKIELDMIYELLSDIQNELAARKSGYKERVLSLLKMLNSLPDML